jgi:hypothetical protein
MVIYTNRRDDGSCFVGTKEKKYKAPNELDEEASFDAPMLL